MNGDAALLDRSLSILAHELREPIASILFAAQSIEETTVEDSTQREMWGVVQRQTRHLTRIIDQVLTQTRGGRPGSPLRKEWFHLGTAIMSAVESVKPLVVNRRHCLTVSLPADDVYLLADSLRLQQIVINLLTNAARYTEPGGSIDLILKATDDLVVLEVRDNGIGIPKEILPRVFDLFEQGGQGEATGLGIGLALVKSLVELHGGSVTAWSAGVGTGSAFVVRIPSAKPAPGPVSQNGLWREGAMMDA